MNKTVRLIERMYYEHNYQIEDIVLRLRISEQKVQDIVNYLAVHRTKDPAAEDKNNDIS